MKPTAAIFDMDGSLCDVSSIRYHVNPKDPRFSGKKRFDRFHSESINCPPNAQAVRLHMEAIKCGHKILIVTARKAQWSFHTALWLKENDIHYDEMFMRADNDNRKDYDVKHEILTDIRSRYHPVLAVDDNPAVIRVWEEASIDTVTIPGWDQDG